MSEKNVEIVRRGIEALNRRDLPAARTLWRPDAELDWSRSRGPLKGVYRGRAEDESSQIAVWATLENVEIAPHGCTKAGSHVVVPNTAHMRGRDGMEVSASSTFVYTVENRQITRLRMFQEQAEALEALGLSE